MERRLTTIAAADIAGFSRLIGVDEEGTLLAQRSHRTELVDPLIELHGGRVANTAGDSLLVEFPSAVEALRCAISIQEGMTTRNADTPDEKRIQFRIGINVGDVVVDGEDLLGDGVNIAARLEGLADPGGIVLSGSARDHTKSLVTATLEDLGEQRLKNIAEPIRAWKVATGEKATVKPARQSRKFFASLAAAAIAILALTYFAWSSLSTSTPSSFAEPSIAVLPFQDLSESPEEWFGDGMAEDIITDLSKISGLVVIARNSSFQYRGGAHDLRDIGRELGVKFLLEGSVRRAGGQLRINAQLIDAQTGAHLWAERYDGEDGDVFSLQDGVTNQVVESLRVALTDTEAAAVSAIPTKVLAAHEAYIRARSYMALRTKTSFAEAKKSLDRALELDPTYSDALGARADLYKDANDRGWTAEIGISPRMEESVVSAILAADEFPSALNYSTRAWMHIRKPDPEAAKASVAKGLALSPNDPDLLIVSAFHEMRTGRREEALRVTRLAMEIDPKHQAVLLHKGIVHFFFKEHEEAIKTFDQALQRSPSDWYINAFRGLTFAEVGRFEEAKADMAIVKANWPPDWGPFTAPVASWFWGLYFDSAYRDRLKLAVELAGVPSIPEGYNIKPENRLNRDQLVELVGSGGRSRIMVPNGELTIDYMADGARQHYWNGSPISTSKISINDDGSWRVSTDQWYGQDYVCETFLNPDGSTETFNTHILFCAVGVFYSSFEPL